MAFILFLSKSKIVEAGPEMLARRFQNVTLGGSVVTFSTKKPPFLKKPSKLVNSQLWNQLAKTHKMTVHFSCLRE